MSPRLDTAPVISETVLAMPPKMTLANIMQMFMNPRWAFNSLLHGKPNFESLVKYMGGK